MWIVLYFFTSNFWDVVREGVLLYADYYLLRDENPFRFSVLFEGLYWEFNIF